MGVDVGAVVVDTEVRGRICVYAVVAEATELDADEAACIEVLLEPGQAGTSVGVTCGRFLDRNPGLRPALAGF